MAPGTITHATDRELVGGDCSCCGSDQRVYRAGLVDSDGSYYPRLCGWCFDAIEAEIAKETDTDPAVDIRRSVAAELLTHMPDEADDAIVTVLEDLS